LRLPLLADGRQKAVFSEIKLKTGGWAVRGRLLDPCWTPDAQNSKKPV